MNDRGRSIVRGLAVPVAAVALLELWAFAVDLQSDSLARPSEISVSAFAAVLDGRFLWWTAQTLWAAGAGLALGGSLGLISGILLGLSRPADRLMEFSVESLRPIPAVALIPIAMLVYGFGYRMEVAIVAFATVWPILILTRAAVRGIDIQLIEVSRILGFGLFDHIRKIVLPAALPRIFVAFRLAVGVSLIVSVTVEISANPLGLGYAMMVAQQSLAAPLMFALLLWIGVVGWSLNVLLLWMQRRLFGPAAIAEAQP